MKEITLPSHIYWYSATGVPMDVNVAVARTTDVRRNASKVLLAALLVERELEALINNYLYPGESEQKTFMARNILGSDALSFAAKRRLMLALVRDKKWFEGADYAAFEKGLRDVMTYRNALTHGNVIEKDEGTVLEYFADGPQSKVLDDAYWDKLVAVFNAVIEQIGKVKVFASQATSPST